MRRALGKGLSQLLGDSVETGLQTVPVGSIRPNARQPRLQFDLDSLRDLADSIREHGLLQPLVVRPVGDDSYELIAGERRLRAAQLAGLEEVPVVLRAASAQASLEMAIIENVQREDISAMECAKAYQRLADEFDQSHEQIASKVGKSRVAVSNTLRLLKLPEAMQTAIMEGRLSEGHARALLMVDSPTRQAWLFEKILRDGMSVREAERLARAEDSATGQTVKSKPQPKLDPDWVSLERGLSEYFGSPVKLTKEKVGGKLALEFYSDDDLQRILDILGLSL